MVRVGGISPCLMPHKGRIGHSHAHAVNQLAQSCICFVATRLSAGLLQAYVVPRLVAQSIVQLHRSFCRLLAADNFSVVICGEIAFHVCEMLVEVTSADIHIAYHNLDAGVFGKFIEILLHGIL